MKSFWFPVLLMVIAAGVAMVELTHAPAEREAEMRQLAAYRAAEAADSEWIAPSLYLEAEPTGEDRKMVTGRACACFHQAYDVLADCTARAKYFYFPFVAHSNLLKLRPAKAPAQKSLYGLEPDQGQADFYVISADFDSGPQMPSRNDTTVLTIRHL